MAALLSSIYSGRRIVQLPAFSPEAWLALAERERITNAFVVPTMLARIVEALEASGAKAPATLRAVAYGGGKMPLPVIERAMRLFASTDFTNAYGLTETSSTLAVLGPADHREAAGSADPNVRRRLSSVGKPLPGVEIEIRDAEGKPVGPGERGEICVRGEQVSGEYLGRASRVGPDGWFPTNDAGFLDEEWLPVRRGPHRRRDRARRREPLARRDRGRPARAPGRRRRRGGRRARRRVGRGRRGRGGPQGGRFRQRRPSSRTG